MTILTALRSASRAVARELLPGAKLEPQPGPRFYAATKQDDLRQSVARINTRAALERYVESTTPAERELHSALVHDALSRAPFKARSGRVYRVARALGVAGE